MKRKAVFVSILLMLSCTLSAKVSYQPSLTFSTGGVFTYKFDDMLRSSYSARMELDPIAIQFKDTHTISIPIYITYVSRTPFFDGYCLNSHMDFGLGLSYRYTFNPSFSLKTVTDMNFRFVPDVHGAIYAWGVTIEPWYHFNSKIAIAAPLRVGGTKGEVSLAPSLCLVITPNGAAL